MFRVAFAVLAAFAVALVVGYVSLNSRVGQLSNELENLRRVELSSDPTQRPTAVGVKVVRSPRPSNLITVITNGGGRGEGEWPPCSSSTSMCVDRVLAPCDEVELAYSYGHMMQHARFPAFRARRGALMSHQGKALSAEDVVKMAKEQKARFDGGPEAALDAWERGDRTRLVGTYTERDEIDVFVPAAVGLDFARCTDRESRFEIIESDER